MVRETGDHRGDTTRRTILHTAIEMFAASGFEGVSTRALAARAGVNQPAIQYHFESKTVSIGLRSNGSRRIWPTNSATSTIR